MREPKTIILIAIIAALVGFFLISDYIPGLGIVGNAMRGMIFGVLPYRYLLICILFLIGYGLYRLLIAPGK